MHKQRTHIGHWVTGAVLLVMVPYLVRETWLARVEILDALPEIVLLASLAAGASRASRAAPGRHAIRLAGAFILVALATTPSPGALWVAAAALLGGAGGVLGVTTAGRAAAAGTLLAVAMVQPVVAVLPQIDRGPSAGGLLVLAVLYVLAQGVALSIGWALEHLEGTGVDAAARLSGASVATEALIVPVAWVLTGLAVPDPHPGALAVAGGLVILATWGAATLLRTRSDVQATNDALAARVAELATLHAIGREIVSTLDLSRVYSIVDRDCRKILDVERFLITLVDPDSAELRRVYSRRRGEPPREREEPGSGPVERRVAATKRPFRSDEVEFDDAPDPCGRDGARCRSLLAVPLIVEERVIGVLQVQSHRPAAYDDHQLSVLTTIAQQAAVAVENARHYKMATLDSLTGLFLRDYFFRRVEEEYHRARRYGGEFALLMLDLDTFKDINDRHGHAAGDRLLQEIGHAVRGRLRTADLACRYGGDEICLLLPETDRDGAVIIADRLRRSIDTVRISIDGDVVGTTVSIGISAFPEDDTGDLTVLLRRADQAMYRAKSDGRDRVATFRTGRRREGRLRRVSPTADSA